MSMVAVDEVVVDKQALIAACQALIVRIERERQRRREALIEAAMRRRWRPAATRLDAIARLAGSGSWEAASDHALIPLARAEHLLALAKAMAGAVVAIDAGDVALIADDYVAAAQQSQAQPI